MRKIIYILIAITVHTTLLAQSNIETLLTSIENNNTTLRALQQEMEAEKLGNRCDIYLSGPEVGFNYLWSNPSSMGRRQDISVTQSFDYATLSGQKSRVANQQNTLVEWQYKGERMNILLKAKELCLELVYYNALLKELSTRLQHAKIVEKGEKERYEKGDANILEYNNAQLNLSTAESEISRIETEQATINNELKILNGGEEFNFSQTEFDNVELPVDFAQWYAEAELKSPILAYVKQSIEVNRQQLSLNKSTGLPRLNAGYMSENITGDNYQGLTLGLSIPLWENKNKVKLARASLLAAQAREIDAKQQFYGQLNGLYQRAAGMKKTADKYQNSLKNANNSTLLKKALDAGQISILNYIMEISLYYNSVNQALEAQRDYQITVAQLWATEL